MQLSLTILSFQVHQLFKCVHYLDLVIIDAIAMTQPYFTVHKTFLDLKVYHIIITCLNPLCCIHYIALFSLCIFSLCRNLKTNLFISNVLSTILFWIQKKSLFD